MEFNDAIKAVLAEYHQRMEKEKDLQQSLPREKIDMRIHDFLLPVGEVVGQFLNNMIKAADAKVILEVGTSYGYSTLWLAEAASQTGGKVITLEIHKPKVAYAQAQISKAGLSDFVEFRAGNALRSLRKASETFDFVLVDIWKELYVPAFELFFPKLKPGAYVIADNMIHPAVHQAEVAKYRQAVRAKQAFDTVLLPIGSGIEVSQLIA